MAVWVNGERSQTETVSVHDAGFVRGDGCFEAVRSYAGQPFAVAEHLERLQRSAEALGLDLPELEKITVWIDEAAAVAGDGIVRIIATRGGPDPDVAPPVVIVMTEPLPPKHTALALLPMRAPWHPAGRRWELAGAKTLSYGPNVNASRVARSRGFDDAVLLSDDEILLEGPTFTIGWVVEGVVETPSLDLFILDSITRRYVIDHDAVEGRFGLSRLAAASEVFAMSTLKEVMPVVRVGDLHFERGPISGGLAAGFRVNLIEAGFAVDPQR
ncbi:MAG: aminotransferase class IV [Acidimicrobiia bacterium]|nr:aminotransferase class IV [Acidimicrobiia bacterium]